jgi:peptidoglycan-associated lipoprotein
MLTRFVVFSLAMLTIAACETTSEETGAAAAGKGGGTSDRSGVSTLPPSSYSTSPVPPSGVQRGTLGNPADLERELVSTGDTVYFAFDSYSLDDQAQATLDRQATVLLKSGSIPVTIQGHADERGTREYNLALGERRATAVKDYLVAFGVNASRIRTLSYGEERPAVPGSSEAAWAKNRRATTVVVGGVAGS